MFAILSAVTANYHGICRKNAPSEARGKWKCPGNLPTLVINKYFNQRAVTALTPGKNTTAYAKQVYTICVCKGIGDLYATCSITVCTI